MKGYVFCMVFLGFALVSCENNPSSEDLPVEKLPDYTEDVDPEHLEYAKGSICGYCTYCKFCSYCDKDCPCESDPSKPNCHMCKYCKYCYLCQSLCDTVCTPGGLLDSVSSAIVNALPLHEYNKEDVAADLDSVQDWMKAEGHSTKPPKKAEKAAGQKADKTADKDEL